MRRNHFLKLLLGLPFGSFVAKKMQARQAEEQYLLSKFYVAGFQYYDGPSLIRDIDVGELLTLEAESGNDYDSFAVAIYRKGTMIGHVPRTDNKHISRLLQQNVSLECRIVEVKLQQETWKMLRVEVWL